MIRGRSAAALALVTVGAAAAATSTPARPFAPAHSERAAATLTIASATLVGGWKESFFRNGSVQVNATVDAPAELGGILRRAAPPTNVLSRATASVPAAGDFTVSLRVPPRPVPGAYTIRLIGSAGGAPVEATAELTIPAPAEGIVDTWAFSRTKGGKPVGDRVTGPVRELWVRFHFQVMPQAKTLRFVWRDPQFKIVGKPQPRTRKRTYNSFIRTAAPLRKGVWYSFLEADGVIVKRARIRVA